MGKLLVPLLLFTLILLHSFTSNANLQKNRLFSSKLTDPPNSPTVFFEVTKPIDLPKQKPCSSLVLQHDFGYTYGKPPVTASYRPPTNCQSLSWSKVVLEWSATCKGRQFDRVFGIWLGGVEILRSCTAEPRSTGIIWTVNKDITRFSSLLRHPQTVSVYLGNLVDQTYTGIYHVNLTFHFYPIKNHPDSNHGFGSKILKSVSGYNSPADLILPISRSPPLNDGYWFLIGNSSDVQFKEFKIPPNAYRAVLEVFVSFHSDDEFWYGNPPNDYITANNLTGIPGNGAFREVVVRLDGKVVGAVWPFTVIYTGGINPLLWRPITGIGSFDLPSYDIEITPFLGEILDGKTHRLGFGVTDALSVWFVDANLHLWLDSRSSQTSGKLIKYQVPSYNPSLVSKFKGLDGFFDTNANRHISFTGWVKSSYGKITTHSYQEFDYTNLMQFRKNSSLQIVNQTIDANYGVFAKYPSADLYSVQVYQKFPLYLYTETVDQGNETFSSISNVSLGFNEDRFAGARYGFSFSSLRNSQDAQGFMLIKGNLVTSGLGATRQVYRFHSTDGCYFRNVSSRNYTILSDQSGELCSKRSRLGMGASFNTWLPIPARRASLASDLHSQNGE